VRIGGSNPLGPIMFIIDYISGQLVKSNVSIGGDDNGGAHGQPFSSQMNT